MPLKTTESQNQKRETSNETLRVLSTRDQTPEQMSTIPPSLPEVGANLSHERNTRIDISNVVRKNVENLYPGSEVARMTLKDCPNFWKWVGQKKLIAGKCIRFDALSAMRIAASINNINKALEKK